jgi:hypothetical protein
LLYTDAGGASDRIIEAKLGQANGGASEVAMVASQSAGLDNRLTEKARSSWTKEQSESTREIDPLPQSVFLVDKDLQPEGERAQDGSFRNRERQSMAKKPPTKVIYRSAVSGRIVTPQYAKAHPKTTEKEHRPVGKKKPR